MNFNSFFISALAIVSSSLPAFAQTWERIGSHVDPSGNRYYLKRVGSTCILAQMGGVGVVAIDLPTKPHTHFPVSNGGVFDALINEQQQKRHYPQAESLKLS